MTRLRPSMSFVQPKKTRPSRRHWRRRAFHIVLLWALMNRARAHGDAGDHAPIETKS